MKNLLDHVCYHSKWHGTSQEHRVKYKYSQNDQLIRHIFEKLQITRGAFVEFGAWDGIVSCNTRLLYENGWNRGIYIESDTARFQELEKNYKHEKEIFTFNSYLDCKNNLFDDIVRQAGVSHIDFCSIDIDGLDLKIFQTFEEFLPTVVCIEGGQSVDPLASILDWDISKNNIQQSLKVYNEVFEKKGYKLLASYQDNFFIKKEFFHLFDVSTCLLEHYLAGIKAYPRIPWLYNQLYKNGLNNRILNFIIGGLDKKEILHIANFGTATEKAAWVDANYNFIVTKCDSILKKREQVYEFYEAL